MHHIRKYYSISSFQTIPEQEDMADDIEGQEVKTTKRIPREADFLTYSCDSYCLKTQSGGDFYDISKNCIKLKPLMEFYR
jgi:hypothetical protein